MNFSASWDLCVAIPIQPFRARLGWITDIRNDQECEICLLCKHLSMFSLFLLTFYCLLAQCTTPCNNFYSCSILAAFISSIMIRGIFLHKSFWKYPSSIDEFIAQLKRNEQKDAIHQEMINYPNIFDCSYWLFFHDRNAVQFSLLWFCSKQFSSCMSAIFLKILKRNWVSKLLIWDNFLQQWEETILADQQVLLAFSVVPGWTF